MCVNKRLSVRSILNHPDLIARLDPRSKQPKYALLMAERGHVVFHQTGNIQIWEAPIADAIADVEFTSNLCREDLVALTTMAAQAMSATATPS